MDGHRITMLGTGLIGDFYTMTLHGQRSRDRVRVVYSRSEARGSAFRDRWDIEESTTDLAAAIEHPDTDIVVIGLPNFLHEEAVGLAAEAGKPVLCTKPLGRTAEEARRMLAMVEDAGVFARLSRGPVLHAEDAQGDRVGSWRRGRRRHVGPLSRDASRAAQRLVLGRPADRRRRDHRPRLPLHRDHPELRRQGKPAGRRPLSHRHARPPDRRRGQRHRAHPLRIGRGRPVRGELDVPRRDGPPRRGRRHERDDLAQPFPADRASRCSPPAARADTSPRRPRPRPAGCSRSVTRSRSSATSTCSATCSARSRRAGRRRRRSTTATSSTRSWTPATGRRSAARGSRSTSSGAVRDDTADRREPGAVRRPGGHQARDPARRPPQADPQGRGDGRLQRPGRRRRLRGTSLAHLGEGNIGIA